MHITTTQREGLHQEDPDDDDDNDVSDYHRRRRLYDQDSRRHQSKLHLTDLLSNMDPSTAGLLWDSLVDLVVKTVLVAQPYLYQSYRLCRLGKSAMEGIKTKTKEHSCVCFEILGFDVVIDRSLRPFLLEVISPLVILNLHDLSVLIL